MKVNNLLEFFWFLDEWSASSPDFLVEILIMETQTVLRKSFDGWNQRNASMCDDFNMAEAVPASLLPRVGEDGVFKHVVVGHFVVVHICVDAAWNKWTDEILPFMNGLDFCGPFGGGQPEADPVQWHVLDLYVQT
jgi:hypothetical protein